MRDAIVAPVECRESINFLMPVSDLIEIGVRERRPLSASKNHLCVFFTEHDFDGAALVGQEGCMSLNV